MLLVRFVAVFAVSVIVVVVAYSASGDRPQLPVLAGTGHGQGIGHHHSCGGNKNKFGPDGLEMKKIICFPGIVV